MAIARPKCQCCGHSMYVVAYCQSSDCAYRRQPRRHRHCRQQCACTGKGCAE